MAYFWRLHCYWRKNGYRYEYYQKILHLYFFHDYWLPLNYLFIRGFLDECEKVHENIPWKPSRILMFNLKNTSAQIDIFVSTCFSTKQLFKPIEHTKPLKPLL